jgi:glycerol-3-phosphate dehydrogenase
VKALLVERENDVACATTKANSAIIHAGYDPAPGSLMARVNVLGNAIIKPLASDLDVPYKQIGSLVVGFDDDDRRAIETLLAKGEANGVPGLRILSRDETLATEPALSCDAICALYAPTAAIVSPWELASAQAEAAINAGQQVELDANVTAITRDSDGAFTVTTTRGIHRARFVVNCAGVNSDTISQMVEPPSFTITPRSGEYYILDTSEADLVKHIIFPCPSKHGKGVLVAPTVHGNIIVGPDSKPQNRDNLATSTAGLAYVRERAARLVPGVNFRAAIRNYAGLRADAGCDDFIVGESPMCPGFFNNAGIKSPGLSSAPAIARLTVDMLKNAGLDLKANPTFVTKRSVIRFDALSEPQKQAIIKKDPSYGAIVCRCRTITEGEILAAFRRPLPPRSIDAVKRRVMAGSGRCQGGFCGPRVLELISRYFTIPPEQIPQDRTGMFVVTGETKQGK